MTRLFASRRRVYAASSLFRPLAILASVAILPSGTSPVGEAAPADPPPAVARLFSLVRPEFSGDRALTTVAFVEQRWRWPGNRPFDESIDHVAEQLRAAGYVDEKTAAPTDRLTFRVESRSMSGPAWEPLDASVTLAGASEPILRFATNRNMLAVNSSSTPADGVEAEVVWVGKGDGAAFDRGAVSGKIVFGD